MREVKATRGHDAAMGYKFRARIEERKVKPWVFFGKEYSEYRYVIERHYMSWVDCAWGRWYTNKDKVVEWANASLDRIEAKPQGEYI